MLERALDSTGQRVADALHGPGRRTVKAMTAVQAALWSRRLAHVQRHQFGDAGNTRSAMSRTTGLLS